MTGRATRARLGGAALCALAGLVGAVDGAALAQPAPGAAAPARSFSGQDFGGAQLSTETLQFPLELKASRASVWRTGAAQRIHLDRDVVVTIGSRRFHASEAVGWLETLPGGTAEAPRRQVAAVREELAR